MAVLLSGTTIGGHVAVHANNISTYALTSIPATISPTNIYVGNAIYFGGANNYFNWDGARINSNVGIQSTSDMRAPIFYDSNDTSFYLDPNAGKSLRIAGGIEQNNLVGRPFAQWGQGGAATGAVVIKFPGNADNYGMVHAVVDIYEYNGSNVCTIIIGGHNWGSRWYSYGANMVGFTDKPVRVAFKDGKYAIVIGNDSSSWSYGQVVLRKIQNGSYYAGVMDVASGYTVGIEPESSTWISEDLRGLRVGGPVSATNISTGVNASHIVQRDVNGYIYANHINFSTSESENPTISSFITSNGDGWSRKSSLAHVRNQLGNYGNWITTDGRAYPRRSDGTAINFWWDGQGGQPTWLWGSNNGVDFYVWNPSNFSVNYATTAGSAPANGGTSTHTYRGIIEDTRSGQRTPNAYDDYRVSWEFTNQMPHDGNWLSVMTMQGWSDGYAAWQIMGTATTTALENWYLRSGVNGTWNSARTIIHSGNIGSQSVSYAVTSGTSSATTQTDFSELSIGGLGVATREYVTSQGYLTSLPSHNHDDRYLVKGGGWYGSGLPGSRWGGFSASGGEIVFGDGLPNAAQMGILIDGAYLAGENNGFWSLASDNSWGSRRGMYWDGTYLNFTTNSPTSYFYDILIGGSSHKYLTINPGNGYEAMVRYIGGSGSSWYVGKRTSSQLIGTESFHFYSEAAGATVGGINPSGDMIVTGSMRAPIFYDSNNTSYYLDPNSSTSGYFAGTLRQNDGKYVRDSSYRTISGYSDYYSGGNAGWYRVAEITLTGNCSGSVLYGTLYDHRYDGADAYQISVVARAECDFTSNNESHYINVGCTILGSTNYSNYQSKIRVLLVASSTNSRTYELQFYETNWNHDTWQLETTGWTVYSSPQAPRSSTGTARVNYISKQNADYQMANAATYSPIYYDSQDTAYYVDPNSTSKLVQINLGTRDTRLTSNTYTGYVEFRGSASNYLGVGSIDNNGWGYIESVNNSNGLYLYTPAGGRFAFDNGDVTPYNDAENSLGNGSYRWSQVYTSGWLRQYGAQGMYNQDYGTHFYSSGGATWNITGSGGVVELTFRSNHQSTIRGYVYADTANTIGFLNNGGSWSLRTDSSRNTVLYGNLTVGQDVGYSSIYMYDSDEGTREIHCNSNRIGFLNQSSSWGSWCYDDGSWATGVAMYSPIYYDSSDTTFFLDPNADLSLRAYGEICNSNYAEGKMQPGALNIGRTDTNYAWDGGSWAGDVRLGILANTSETWEFGIHDSGDSVMSVVHFDGGSTLTMGRNLGWGQCIVNAPAGYVSNSNPWGTANSAFFPNGITTAGGTNWIYGFTYIGNAPANGNGHEFNANGTQYSTTSITTPTFIVNNHSDNTRGYRIHNTSGSSVSAMFTNSSNALVIAAGAFEQVNLNKKVYVNGVALGVNVAPSATAGRIDASNDIVAYSSSDERLKQNIAPIENALDKVKSLTGVEFDWKPEYKHAHGYEGHDTGVIAQQVEAVMPSAVRTNDTGFLAVRYEKLIGLLIEGMKEQQAQIDELKAKLDGLTK